MNIHQQNNTREFMTLATVDLDPWDLQAKLMRMSAQRLPLTPQLNAGVVTYLALTLEEASELLTAVVGAIRSALPENSQEGGFPGLLTALSPELLATAAVMHTQSLEIRKAVAGLSSDAKLRAIPLKLHDAAEMLDAYTDLHVVTAGGSLSAGLPGGPAYDEVVGSNLSKANPETGLIDIDTSGKWIKGPNYRAPDLSSLIHCSATDEDF